jgi:hypothetical protein
MQKNNCLSVSRQLIERLEHQAWTYSQIPASIKKWSLSFLVFLYVMLESVKTIKIRVIKNVEILLWAGLYFLTSLVNLAGHSLPVPSLKCKSLFSRRKIWRLVTWSSVLEWAAKLRGHRTPETLCFHQNLCEVVNASRESYTGTNEWAVEVHQV